MVQVPFVQLSFFLHNRGFGSVLWGKESFDKSTHAHVERKLTNAVRFFLRWVGAHSLVYVYVAYLLFEKDMVN